MSIFDETFLFQSYARFIPTYMTDFLPWSVFEKLKVGPTVPFLGTNILRTLSKTAWHIQPLSTSPHSLKYRIKKSICDDDIHELSKALNKANINSKVDLFDTISPLMLAAKLNRKNIVKYLILKGADINDKDITGGTALMHAVTNMSFEVIKLLVENGANIDERDNYGVSPLEKAQLKNFYFIQRYFKESKGKYDKPDFPRFRLQHDLKRRLDNYVKVIEEMKSPRCRR